MILLQALIFIYSHLDDLDVFLNLLLACFNWPSRTPCSRDTWPTGLLSWENVGIRYEPRARRMGSANSDNFRVNVRTIDPTQRGASHARITRLGTYIRLISSIPSLPNLIAAIQARHRDWWRLDRICPLQCQLSGPLLKSWERATGGPSAISIYLTTSQSTTYSLNVHISRKLLAADRSVRLANADFATRS